MTFPHSFSITQSQLGGQLKVKGLRGGKRDTASHCNFTCRCRCWTVLL